MRDKTRDLFLFFCVCFLASLGLQAELQNTLRRSWVVIHPHPATPSRSDFLKPCQAPDCSFVMPVTFIFIHHLKVIPHAFYCLPCLWVMVLIYGPFFPVCPQLTWASPGISPVPSDPVEHPEIFQLPPTLRWFCSHQFWVLI